MSSSGIHSSTSIHLIWHRPSSVHHPPIYPLNQQDGPSSALPKARSHLHVTHGHVCVIQPPRYTATAGTTSKFRVPGAGCAQASRRQPLPVFRLQASSSRIEWNVILRLDRIYGIGVCFPNAPGSESRLASP
ncbi:hypothetical protein E4U50_004024, partial [Claviceps purpurea]